MQQQRREGEKETIGLNLQELPNFWDKKQSFWIKRKHPTT